MFFSSRLANGIGDDTPLWKRPNWGTAGSATSAKSLGKYDQAEQLCLDVLNLLPQTDASTAHAQVSREARQKLAQVYSEQDRFDEAARLLKDVIADVDKVGPINRNLRLQMKRDLASVYDKQARHIEAEVLLLEVLDGFTELLGEQYPKTVEILNRLGALQGMLGKLPEAAESLR